MATVDYSTLYTIQDRVLAAVFSSETVFYLTGGTCLHRFFYNRRYSNDLDLFTSENSLFRDEIRLMKDRLIEQGIHFELQVDTRDFVRIEAEEKLRVDLVNDRVYRYGSSIRSSQGFVLDNLHNLCANKICAILGRDDPKDVFDLYTLFREAELDWAKVITAAMKKCVVDHEVFEYRLSSFPLDLLDLLHVPDQASIEEMKQHYGIMLEKLREVK